MVKLNAPMLSLDASGKLGSAVVFSKWKGRNYARALVTPSNPRSQGQTGMRRMLKFLSQEWADRSAASKSSWNDRADNAVISQFNAYVGVNMKRWRNFLPPGTDDPVTGSATPATIANEAATAGVRQITIDVDVTVANQNWGILIFRGTPTGFDTSFPTLVQVIEAKDVDSYAWIDTPLAAGTYYYNFRPFSLGGAIGGELGEVDATVV